YSEEDLPTIFRELTERHNRIEKFSKDLAKQLNIANRETELLQSAMLPRPPINNPTEPIDNRLPELIEKRSTVEPTRSIVTAHNDYDTEAVIVSPPPLDEKRFLISEKFFQTSTSPPPRARAAPTLPSIDVIQLETPPSETTTAQSTTVPTTTIPTTPPTTPPPEEEEEEKPPTVTLPSVRNTIPQSIRSLRPLSFPPLPKFLPTRRFILPER
ncbi:hypothetical protein PFISCL1PPCAC_19243, partial [Pristionchus fissidentatus]